MARACRADANTQQVAGNAAHVDSTSLHLCAAGWILSRVGYTFAYILVEDRESAPSNGGCAALTPTRTRKMVVSPLFFLLVWRVELHDAVRQGCEPVEEAAMVEPEVGGETEDVKEDSTSTSTSTSSGTGTSMSTLRPGYIGRRIRDTLVQLT
jgi:hypothetical protein